jgi:hypothetical protein
MQAVKIRTSAHVNLWPEVWRRKWLYFSMKMAETIPAIFGPIVFSPFEYSAQTDKIHYSAQNDSALSNSAQRSTTINIFTIQFQG